MGTLRIQSAQKGFGQRSRQCPFTDDAVFATADRVVCSLGIWEEFTRLCQELGQAFLVLEFESECMIGKREPVAELICGFADIAVPPGDEERVQNSVRSRRVGRRVVERGSLCVHHGLVFVGR